MELRDISMDDLPLYERVLTDPRMMAHLGGPLPTEGLEEKLRGIVEQVRDGDTWFSVIVADGEERADAGWVCIWTHDEHGEPINEMGWMVAPEFQGRGLANRAVQAMLDRARSEDRWGVVHAFPGADNAPSNAICRRAGFSLIGEGDFEYAGRPLRCNRWRIDLSSRSRR